MPAWTSTLFVAAGLFSLAGAAFDWQWFMANSRAAVFVRLIGRTGARVLYALLGLFLVGLGMAGFLGILE